MSRLKTHSTIRMVKPFTDPQALITSDNSILLEVIFQMGSITVTMTPKGARDTKDPTHKPTWKFHSIWCLRIFNYQLLMMIMMNPQSSLLKFHSIWCLLSFFLCLLPNKTLYMPL